MVTVSWSEPETNGGPITAYSIYIRRSTNTQYSTETINCDGTSQAVIDAQQCSIPVEYLTGSPFNLPWGASVWAKVSATNEKGTSS